MANDQLGVDQAWSGSGSAAVADEEFVAFVGWEEAGDVAQSLGQGGCGEEWIFAFAQILVVDVGDLREHIDGKGVGEGCFLIVFASLFVGRGCGGFGVGLKRFAARLPCVAAGFSADVGLSLGPDKLAKGSWNADGIDEVVGDVDAELEGESEAVFGESSGEKNSLDGAKRKIAMTACTLGGVVGVSGCDEDILALGENQRDEVIAAIDEGGREDARDDADEMLHLGVGDARLSPTGEAQAIGSCGDGGEGGYLFGGNPIKLSRDGHCFLY
jgi:hypothetical protein